MGKRLECKQSIYEKSVTEGFLEVVVLHPSISLEDQLEQ